ncbi:MAG: hypothetical protein PHY57_11155 [Ignavibacterium sp.]|nr:MAG: hypothetical protein F9K42_01995 [Ignavibacterium sp.]MDD5609062.1 hypothetical protein [Ignavibacterium sp.]
MKIIIKLQQTLPEDFNITYEKLKDWYLGKYKPNPNLTDEIYKLNIKSIAEIELIFEDAHCVAGKFNLPVMGQSDIKELNVDFMIAKHILERTKHRSGFRIDNFNQLTEKQVNAIHAKFIDDIVPKCLERLRQHNEFLRQKMNT